VIGLYEAVTAAECTAYTNRQSAGAWGTVAAA
jgi:hypothetical protein